MIGSGRFFLILHKIWLINLTHQIVSKNSKICAWHLCVKRTEYNNNIINLKNFRIKFEFYFWREKHPPHCAAWNIMYNVNIYRQVALLAQFGIQKISDQCIFWCVWCACIKICFLALRLIENWAKKSLLRKLWYWMMILKQCTSNIHLEKWFSWAD